MRYQAIVLLGLLAASNVHAQDDADDVVLHTSTELREWCQRESQARLIGDSKTPNNWTARHYEKANTLMVDGRWRVDGEDIEVSCRAGRGARAEFATLELRSRTK